MGKHTSVWLIEALTNLHVGNESIVNFSVIDKAIQRDAATQLPCINSSSLKGAIKEFLSSRMEQEDVIKIFGSIKKDKKAEIRKGSAMFFDANLLALPEPSTKGGKLYNMVTCEEVLNAFFEKAKALGAGLDKNKGPWQSFTKRKTSDFENLCSDDSLPIIARNCLENGESVNLWYEQVLPSKSLLGVVIQTENETDLDALNGKVVQIGANATIGYGYCKFTKL